MGRSCRLPFLLVGIAVGLGLAHVDEVHRVEDERHGAVAEDGRPGEGFEARVQLGQLLDDGLVVADDLVDDEADPFFAARDDDDLLVDVGRARRR